MESIERRQRWIPAISLFLTKHLPECSYTLRLHMPQKRPLCKAALCDDHDEGEFLDPEV